MSGFNWLDNLAPAGPFEYPNDIFSFAERKGFMPIRNKISFSGGEDDINNDCECMVYWLSFKSYFPNDYSFNKGENFKIPSISHSVSLVQSDILEKGPFEVDGQMFSIESISNIQPSSPIYIFDKFPSDTSLLKDKFWTLSDQFSFDNNSRLIQCNDENFNRPSLLCSYNKDYTDLATDSVASISVAELGLWRIKFNFKGGAIIIKSFANARPDISFYFLISGHYDPIMKLPYVRLDGFFNVPALYADYTRLCFDFLSEYSIIDQLSAIFLDRGFYFQAKQCFDYNIVDHIA